HTLPPPPTPTLFPYTTLFRSSRGEQREDLALALRQSLHAPIGRGACRGRRAPFAIDPQGVMQHVEQRRVIDRLLEEVEGAVLQRSEEHTSELQSHLNLVCRLL